MLPTFFVHPDEVGELVKACRDRDIICKYSQTGLQESVVAPRHMESHEGLVARH